MGEVRVPAGALYKAQTQRAVDNFPISGIRFPRTFIQALGMVKAAAAAANHELGLMDAAMAEAVRAAAMEVAEGKHDAHFPIDIFQTGSGTSTNMNANEVIATVAAEKLGSAVHPNDHVNMSQSSNDVIPHGDSRERLSGNDPDAAARPRSLAADAQNQSGIARSRGQDRQNAPDGRFADSHEPGTGGLGEPDRAGHAARARGAFADFAAGAGRYGSRHGRQCAPGIRRAGQPGGFRGKAGCRLLPAATISSACRARMRSSN